MQLRTRVPGLAVAGRFPIVEMDARLFIQEPVFLLDIIMPLHQRTSLETLS